MSINPPISEENGSVQVRCSVCGAETTANGTLQNFDNYQKFVPASKNELKCAEHKEA